MSMSIQSAENLNSHFTKDASACGLADLVCQRTVGLGTHSTIGTAMEIEHDLFRGPGSQNERGRGRPGLTFQRHVAIDLFLHDARASVPHCTSRHPFCVKPSIAVLVFVALAQNAREAAGAYSEGAVFSLGCEGGKVGRRDQDGAPKLETIREGLIAKSLQEGHDDGGLNIPQRLFGSI